MFIGFRIIQLLNSIRSVRVSFNLLALNCLGCSGKNDTIWFCSGNSSSETRCCQLGFTITISKWRRLMMFPTTGQFVSPLAKLMRLIAESTTRPFVIFYRNHLAVFHCVYLRVVLAGHFSSRVETIARHPKINF